MSSTANRAKEVFPKKLTDTAVVSAPELCGRSGQQGAIAKVRCVTTKHSDQGTNAVKPLETNTKNAVAFNTCSTRLGPIRHL